MGEFRGAVWQREDTIIGIGPVPGRKQVAFYSSTSPGLVRVHGYFPREEDAVSLVEILHYITRGGPVLPEFLGHVPLPRVIPPSGARKLTPAEARAARKLRATRRFSIRDLAAMYGISRSSMSYVVHGRTYKSAGGPIEPARSVKYTRSTVPIA